MTTLTASTRDYAALSAQHDTLVEAQIAAFAAWDRDPLDPVAAGNYEAISGWLRQVRNQLADAQVVES